MNATVDAEPPGQAAITAFRLILPAIIAVAALICFRFWPSGLDPGEPPLIPSSIPLIGHAIGMLRQQQRYFEMLSNKYQLPIFTLKILSGRLYIVTAPDLIAAIFRNAKVFSFEPFLLQSTENIMDVKSDIMDIIKKPAEVEGGDTYLNDVHKAMYDGLASPQALLDMERDSFRTIARYLNEIGTEGLETKWYRWLRDMISRAAADAMYGPDNPVAHDPSLIDTIWDFDSGVPALMLNLLPSLLASRAHKARTVLEKAWLPYYTAGLQKNASAIVRGRRAAALKWGIPDAEAKRWEYVMFFAPVTNSGPTAYWLLSYLLAADEGLVEEIRAEIAEVVTISDTSTVDGGTGEEEEKGEEERKVTLDVTRLQKDCPLLVAAWEESFRLRASTVSVRMVMEDTYLPASSFAPPSPSTTSPTPSPTPYLLKKGSTLHLPSTPSSLSSTIWGPSPETFNPHRMLKPSHDALPRDARKLRTQAYFPWGGGRYICPGRAFATAELLGVVASLLYFFDIRRRDGCGWVAPKSGAGGDRAKRQLGRNVDLPGEEDERVEVVVRRRRGFEGARIAFEVGKGVVV